MAFHRNANRVYAEWVRDFDAPEHLGKTQVGLGGVSAWSGRDLSDAVLGGQGRLGRGL